MIPQIERIRTSLTIGEYAGMGLYWNSRNGFFIVIVNEAENRIRIEDVSKKAARKWAKIILTPSNFEGLFPGGVERGRVSALSLSLPWMGILFPGSSGSL